jgi:hypothetical protein
VRRFVGNVIVLVLVELMVLTVVRDRVARLDDDVLHTPSMADAPWWPEHAAALEEMRMRVRLDSFTVDRLPDVASSTLNIVDGRRVTWHPPEGPCRPLKVWMFGGSTTFGEGQRDDRTIPSAVAHAAWDAGLRLDVTNYGVLGSGEPPPDVVTFYDGINEFEIRRQLNDDGRRADAFAVSYLDTGFFPAAQGLMGTFEDIVRPTRKVRITPDHVQRLSATEIGSLIAREYRSSVESARRLLADHSIEGYRFDQPTIYSRAEHVAGEPDVGVSEAAFAHDAFDVSRRAFPAGVTDLRGAFDAVPEPLFRDSSHTNERGADIIGHAIFEHLEPSLRARCAAEAGRCC